MYDSNIVLAFFEGFALIISPCILPILPLILSGSLEGSKKRPFGIITGFVITFALFTFFAKKLVQISGIDFNLIRNISFGLLFLLGLIMASSVLTEQFRKLTQHLANIGTSTTLFNNPKGGFASGILFGGLIGLVWTPCAGPILAAVIVQTVLQTTVLASFLTVLSFGMGAATPMLLIACAGRGIMKKFNFFKTRAILLRKILGVIIMASVIGMIFSSNIALSFTQSRNLSQGTDATLKNGLLISYSAPAITGIARWINSDPLQLGQLKGKVVLIDFWAYSCINCARTIPYLNNWYEKYHEKGLIIVGVHSPEFDFEKNFNNVQKAVKDYGIKYPVALDNNFVTWQNYSNKYWPAHYLIDKNGNVVYTHFGEGEYDVTENNIRFLLGLTASNIEKDSSANYFVAQTPETYLGYARAEQFSSPETVKKDEAVRYTYPDVLPKNAWALQGSWIVAPEKIVAAQTGAAIKIHFSAGQVYAVMGNSTNKAVKLKLLFNGELLIAEKGKDVSNSSIEVKNHALYTLIQLKQPSSGILELIATEPGVEIYTFTFGG